MGFNDFALYVANISINSINKLNHNREAVGLQRGRKLIFERYWAKFGLVGLNII